MGVKDHSMPAYDEALNYFASEYVPEFDLAFKKDVMNLCDSTVTKFPGDEHAVVTA